MKLTFGLQFENKQYFRYALEYICTMRRIDWNPKKMQICFSSKAIRDKAKKYFDNWGWESKLITLGDKTI
jgi:hypothetical protein